MPTIHPTAIVDRRAVLADDVTIGPYVIIEGPVTIGAGCVVESHSVLRGPCRIGARCKIGPAAFVGLDPQHQKFDPRETESWLIVGDDCIIRENAQLHRSTHEGIEHATRVGNRCFIMSTAHVGHDVQMGDDVVLASGVLIGGHATIGERSFLGGGCAIHQFVRIGRLVVIAGNEATTRDVPPFAAVRYGGIKGYNLVGCRRAGMKRTAIHAIREAFMCLHTHRTMPAAVEAIRQTPGADAPEVQEMLEFITHTKRGIQPSVRFMGGMYGNVDSAEVEAG